MAAMRSLPKCLFPNEIVTDFTVHNLPYGVFSKIGQQSQRCIGVALGDKILDCRKLAEKGILPEYMKSDRLNSFMGKTKSEWEEVRSVLQKLALGDIGEHLDCVVDQKDTELHLPCDIGDYTDFYASREHATNVGVMFRGKENALMPNWLHLPVGYHGRASSVKVSGTPVIRPNGQTIPKEGPQDPSFGPSRLVDFELEIGAFIGGPPTELGQTITRSEAEDRLFGLVLLNDWSARDIQKWEYQPLGPFLAKNFGTVISPWVVPTLALENFRVSTPEQSDVVPLDYLKQNADEKGGFDIDLSVTIESGEAGADAPAPPPVCKSNLKYMYWSLAQQLTHHTSSGCNMNPGDLIGTGTISGPTEDSYGSMLELCWAGQKDVNIGNGEIRKFLKDQDVCVLKGWAQKDGIRVGFGECRSKVLPAVKYGESVGRHDIREMQQQGMKQQAGA